MSKALAFPDDWEQTIVHRGFSRVPTNKAYAVRLSVGGKQVFVSSEITQKDAGKTYDIALWKLCPKIGRKPEPNFPDEFEFITQDMVDRVCPRLNKLYAEAPYLELSDESIPEDKLRERQLTGQSRRRAPVALLGYNEYILDVRRQRSNLLALRVKLEAGSIQLENLHKLAEVTSVLSQIQLLLGSTEEQIKKLEASLESQRPYYQKLVEGVI